MSEAADGVKDLLSDGDSKEAAKDALSTEVKTETKEVSEKPTTSEEVPDLLGDDEVKPKEEIKPRVAPEKYELKVDESLAINNDLLESFQKTAKELNMPQEEAQKIVDLYSDGIKNIQNGYIKTQKDWHDESVKYFSEQGNGNFKEGMKYVAAFKSKFMDSETQSFLKEAGINNNPRLLKLFDKVGRLVSEDNFVDGKNNNNVTISDAELFYGKK